MSAHFFVNFSTLLSNLKEELRRWESTPLSLIGKINTINGIFLKPASYTQATATFAPPQRIQSLPPFRS